MNRRSLRAITAALVLGASGLAFLPIAHASTSVQTLTPSTGAWYQPNPSCAQATGCLTPDALPAPAPVAASPFPAGTLHVGYTGGAETARSFLSVSLAGLAVTPTAAILTVPLDVSASDGSSAPETAHLQACLATGAVTAVEGSFDAPPKISCASHAVLNYIAQPRPHFQADLSSLLSDLPAGTGIVLLPDGDTVRPDDNWRVVFSTPSRADAAKTPPATVTLTLDLGAPTAQAPVTAPEQPAPFAPEPVDAGFPATQPAGGTGFASAPDTGSAVLPPAIDTPAQAPVQAPRTVTEGPVTRPVAQIVRTPLGAAYPAVFLFPLALLVLVPYLGRTLLADLDEPAL